MLYPIVAININNEFFAISLLFFYAIQAQLVNEDYLTSTLLSCFVNARLGDDEVYLLLNRPCELFLPIEVLISPSTRNNKKKQKPQNVYMLYRRNKNKSFKERKDQGKVSGITGESWDDESHEVRKYFGILQKLAAEKFKMYLRKISGDQQTPNEFNNNHYSIALHYLPYTKDASPFPPPCSTPYNEATQVDPITENATPVLQTNLSDNFEPRYVIDGCSNIPQEFLQVQENKLFQQDIETQLVYLLLNRPYELYLPIEVLISPSTRNNKTNQKTTECLYVVSKKF
ncbi:1595_t:CDS:2 [Entrophospora sp. SA101]|nr:1595_t:CDS:2 [Entrophospora sp. SA101]